MKFSNGYIGIIVLGVVISQALVGGQDTTGDAKQSSKGAATKNSPEKTEVEVKPLKAKTTAPAPENSKESKAEVTQSPKTEPGYKVIKPKNESTPATVAPSTRPSFVVSKNGSACIRADFKASFKIKIENKAKSKTKTSEVTSHIPINAKSSGTCADNKATLEIKWGNKTYKLVLTFEKNEKKDKTGKVTMTEWGIAGMTLTVNTKGNKDYKSISKQGVYVLAANITTEMLFAAPLNYSYTCKSPFTVVLRQYNSNNTVITTGMESGKANYTDVKIQAFDLPAKGFSKATVCAADMAKKLEGKNIVPIAVAACLAGIILVIIIAYFISKHMNKTGYKSVE